MHVVKGLGENGPTFFGAIVIKAVGESGLQKMNPGPRPGADEKEKDTVWLRSVDSGVCKRRAKRKDVKPARASHRLSKSGGAGPG
jgi:hypothetical protein